MRTHLVKPLCGCLLTMALAALAPVLVLANTVSRDPAATDRVVLPTSVTPDHYRIDITPDAKTLTFKGSVEIDVTVHQPTDRLVLNSLDLAIDSAALSGQRQAPTISYDEGSQTVTFTVDHTLKPGPYTLRLRYQGKIYQQASGLFALDYDTPQGTARALFTQFENSDGRRFVPSWDEPARKATFQLTATVPAHLMPLSNMPVVATDALPGHLKRVYFATSPKMSSYLLFFGLGDFERIHRTVDGVDLGVVVKRGDIASARYALNAAAIILPYYNRYFDTPYPLPKLDLIAGPGSSQFFGAMENWGAIFYFERDLLVEAGVSTERDKQRVYLVVAHEMSHQWFGDLVTMDWWDDLWLNEGFASWMENKVTDHFHPEWKVWLQALGDKEYAMQIDARDGTHPIITPIKDVLQASAAFDDITYQKGAAVIRTLESYVGENAFRAGVRRYMRDHAYGNTVTDQLWQEIDRSTTRPITAIAHDLTLQAGVPVVEEMSAKCTDGNSELRLVQGHFAVDFDSTAARTWHIPVIIRTVGGASGTTVVSGAEPEIFKIAGCGAALINAGQTAYFRSRYAPEGLAAIAASYGTLSADDQLGLLNDTTSLAYVGEEPVSALLDLIKNLPRDADPVVSSALVDLLRDLDRIYDGLPTQTAFRSYAREVLNPIYARVGWDRTPGESDNVALLRSNLLTALGNFDEAAVIAEAKKRFDQYLAAPSRLDAETRRVVLQIVAVHADQVKWNQLHGLAKAAKTELERLELYDLLAAAVDRNLVGQALELALSDEPPRTTVPEMIDVASRRYPDMAFDMARAHWDKIGNLLEPSTQPGYMPYLIEDGSDLGLIDKLNGFAESHIPRDAWQDLHKAEARVRYRAKIRNDRLPEIDLWISDHHG